MNFIGDRIIEITAIDVRQNELMNAWLVYATVQCANIAKSYQIMLPIGNNESSIIKVYSLMKMKINSSILKRITIDNRYNIDRTYHLTSSRPDLLKIRESTVHIAARASTTVTLLLMPMNNEQRSSIVDILLYIANEIGIQEDVYCIKIVNADTTIVS